LSATNVISLANRIGTSEMQSLQSRGGRVPVCPYFDIKTDAEGNEYMEVYVRGMALLRLVLTNKGTAFSRDERVALGLDGLLPSQICTLEEQIERAYRGFRRNESPIAKYEFLRGLQDRQEVLFYALVCRHLDEMLPIIYTPTVGEAVRNFSHIYQNPRGLSVAPHNVHRIDDMLSDYPLADVRLIVATDSSAILGIGDQGYGGLAISIGKLALYTVGGGVSPFHTMPVSLDVGTDRQDLLTDPLYLGSRQRRLRGDAYLKLLDRFVEGIAARWPKALIQWEDLSKEAAFEVLERYRGKVPSFNDDIQGTGAVTLSGVLAACRANGTPLTEQRVVVYGAGAGGIGVAWALREGMKRAGLSHEEAAARVLVLDSRGLLLGGRPMSAYKESFATPPEQIAGWTYAGSAPDLLETVRQSGATVLLGLSGQPGSFTREVALAMAANAERPIVFPLSNPTSLSEGTPAELLEWTGGKAMVATGSPFEAVELGGSLYPIGQGNNAFIFPGLGFGAVLAGAREVTDNMVMAASYALASYTIQHHLEFGRIYPPVAELRTVSVAVARAVIEQAVADGVATAPGLCERDLLAWVEKRAWEPKYLTMMAGAAGDPAGGTR
jgi:malate dehydrogenase (oxaloacetate-decarboxylating)